ncbi:PAS domain S-box protein [Niabella insulamsoli]|uniref:PAS domain S-box protein n=1 Tax=Niabella insulamsoli TaxID=3144874 RepID=UPI0031FD70BA
MLSDEKQALLAAIVDSSDDAIISKTLDGIITSWNPAAARILGYKEEEALGRHISIIIPAERLHEEDFIINEITNGRRIQHFETVRQTKYQQQLPLLLSISPVRNADGVVIGASTIGRDICAQKEAAEKQGILAAIVKSSDDAIVSKTLKGIITSWNGGAERLFGYTESEAIGQHISLIIPPDRMDEETYIINQIVSGQSVSHFETLRVTKTGQEIPISLTISPVLDGKGKIIGASKIARDISERLRIQREKELLYNEVKLLSKKKDDFIAMTTHELKTPMTSLMGFLQVLQMRVSSEDPNGGFIRRCIKQVDKLSMLINDLLEFSKDQDGKLQIRPAPFDIVSLIAELIEPYKEDRLNKIEFSAADSLMVNADRLRIGQVIINLLSNAVKYSPNGGRIKIKAGAEDGNIFVSVKDEGIGIDQNCLQNLFDQFYRAVKPGYNIPGLGMGLYISRQIVELHGGEINVASEMGKGSTFKFMLPGLPQQ